MAWKSETARQEALGMKGYFAIVKVGVGQTSPF